MQKRISDKILDSRRRNDEAVATVQQVYSDLKANPPERNCLNLTECCRFQLTGRTPMLTKGEALTAAKELRSTGRKKLPKRDDGACPLLHPQTSRCMIYQGRPFGCRTHFCKSAGGPYERSEVLPLIRRLEEIDECMGGNGPREISAAISDALEEIS